METKTSVYFIQMGYREIKIGVAANPGKRLKQLQIGCPRKLRLMASFEYPDRKTAERVEKGLHERYRWHKIRGEWFHPERLMRHIKKDNCMDFLATGVVPYW